MSEAKCYICAKPGRFAKLFRKCKHESACYECLRDQYVIQPQHFSSYPLKCFHPECNLVIREAQMQRIVRSDKELKAFHMLQKRAKIPAKLQKLDAEMQALEVRKKAAMQVAKWGRNWRKITRVFSSEELCRCPACRALVTRDGVKKYPGVKHANTPERPSWQALAEALGEEEICCCPKCKILIIKDGGCNHMTCFGGKEFAWHEHRQRIDECPDTACSCGHQFSWKSAKEEMEKDVEEVEEAFLPIETEYHRKYHLLVTSYDSEDVPLVRASKPSLASSQKSKSRAPLVRIDEEDDVDEEEDYDLVEEPIVSRAPLTLGQLLPKDMIAESQSVVMDEDYSFCEDQHTGSSIATQDAYNFATSGADSTSCTSISLVQAPSVATLESQFWEQGDHDCVLELASDASDNSWSQFDDESENDEAISPASNRSQTTAPWEEVSEVSSVVSFHSKAGTSFLEAARAAVAAYKEEVKNQGNEWTEVSKAPKPKIPPVQRVIKSCKPNKVTRDEQTDEMFDSYFMFDGTKGGRGGKQKFKNRVFV